MDADELQIAADYLQEADADFERPAKLLRSVADRMAVSRYRDAITALMMSLQVPRSANDRYVVLEEDGSPRVASAKLVRRFRRIPRPTDPAMPVRVEDFAVEAEVLSAMPEPKFREIAAELRRYGWQISPIARQKAAEGRDRPPRSDP